MVPVMSLAALGAYVGPDQTLSGVPAVFIALFMAGLVRRAALRADATLENSGQNGYRISATWPFPLEEPPPRRLVRGYLVSLAGTPFIWIGMGISS
jgi:hypothetical protein